MTILEVLEYVANDRTLLFKMPHWNENIFIELSIDLLSFDRVYINSDKKKALLDSNYKLCALEIMSPYWKIYDKDLKPIQDKYGFIKKK